MDLGLVIIFCQSVDYNDHWEVWKPTTGSQLKVEGEIVKLHVRVVWNKERNLWFLIPMALDLSLSSRDQKVIKGQLFLFKMIKFSVKGRLFSLNPHLEWRKCHLTTWEQENESQRKKEPQIPRLRDVVFETCCPTYVCGTMSLFMKQLLDVKSK